MSWTRNSMDEDADGWYDDDEDDIEATKGNEMKTPEEILQQELSGMSVKIPPVLIPHVIRAMEEYRKQGRHYSPSEISDIQNLAYEEGIKAAYRCFYRK